MGNFSPVVGECEIGDLEVEGTITARVRGVYLRNGPNPAREPLLGAARYHWFDGDGMLHWIRLGDDDESSDDAMEEKKKSPSSPSSPSAAASYGRAYVRTKNFEREASLGESLYTGLRDITPCGACFFRACSRRCSKIGNRRIRRSGSCRAKTPPTTA